MNWFAQLLDKSKTKDDFNTMEFDAEGKTGQHHLTDGRKDDWTLSPNLESFI